MGQGVPICELFGGRSHSNRQGYQLLITTIQGYQSSRWDTSQVTPHRLRLDSESGSLRNGLSEGPVSTKAPTLACRGLVKGLQDISSYATPAPVPQDAGRGQKPKPSFKEILVLNFSRFTRKREPRHRLQVHPQVQVPQGGLHRRTGRRLRQRQAV